MSWGDVSTAWHSTGIANIEAFFEADRNMERAVTLPSIVKQVLGTGTLQRFLKSQIDRRMPPGPTQEQRARGWAVIVASARNAAGVVMESQLTTPEPYKFTVNSAVEIARRVTAGEVAPGFRTPSRAFGAEFVTGFNGVAM